VPRQGAGFVEGIAATDVRGKYGGAVEAGGEGHESWRLGGEGEEVPAGVEAAVQVKHYICGASVLQQQKPHAL
jgi:hypothetical protein